MKALILALTLITPFAFAHDEGHGPKLVDPPKFGGKVAAVIDKSEVNKGIKAKALYKAELTKNNRNVVRVYLYDKTMAPMKLGSYDTATAELLFKDRKTRKWTAHDFKLKKTTEQVGKKELTVYEGKLPTKPRRPFNIDITLEGKDKKLFMAFDGLS